jgi:hypothetical protein
MEEMFSEQERDKELDFSNRELLDKGPNLIPPGSGEEWFS